MTHSLVLRPALRYRIAPLAPPSLRDRSASCASETAARLLDAIRPSILRALTAERADAYVTILAEMLALRRAGTLAPTLDELRRRLSSDADEPAFLRDLLQLEDWACISRELEPRSIRGYRDARRERFRHRLTEDAVALLEWLETRRARAGTALRVDANDRLLDVLERALELARLSDPETPLRVEGGRRALHLLRSIDAELDAITCGLVGLHAEMRRFAERTFERRALERVVAGLEAYVVGLVANMGQRRRELADTMARLSEGETCERLSKLVRAHGDEGISLSSHDEPGRTPLALLARWSAFFVDGGELDEHCAQIETATRDVIAKLRDRLATLERHGDRGHERARAIRTLASIDDTRLGRLGAWGYGMPTWAPGEGTRLSPPLPRRKARPRVEEPRALPTKHTPRRVAAEPRQARVMRTAEWLRDAGLTAGAVRLSEVRHGALRSADAPAAWITVARAQHLGRGVDLSALGVRIVATGGVVTVGDDAVGLASPDCVVTAVDHEGSRP